jgi:hypothetical protein
MNEEVTMKTGTAEEVRQYFRRQHAAYELDALCRARRNNAITTGEFERRLAQLRYIYRDVT